MGEREVRGDDHQVHSSSVADSRPCVFHSSGGWSDKEECVDYSNESLIE